MTYTRMNDANKRCLKVLLPALLLGAMILIFGMPAFAHAGTDKDGFADGKTLDKYEYTVEVYSGIEGTYKEKTRWSDTLKADETKTITIDHPPMDPAEALREQEARAAGEETPAAEPEEESPEEDSGSLEEEENEEALEALGRVGLRERARHLPSQLSGGEQQRVCVARALINHPELVLADEPTGNLDEANENIVLDLFAQLHKEGTTLIVVTHDPEVAEAAQRTIVLEHGKVAREVINENFGK